MYRKGAQDILAVTELNYFLIEDSTKKSSRPNTFNEEDIKAIVFNRNLFHLMDLFVYGQEPICPMYNICSLHEKNDSICLRKPFEQGIKDVGEDICDYGLVAHMFGVHEFPIKEV